MANETMFRARVIRVVVYFEVVVLEKSARCVAWYALSEEFRCCQQPSDGLIFVAFHVPAHLNVVPSSRRLYSRLASSSSWRTFPLAAVARPRLRMLR